MSLKKRAFSGVVWTSTSTVIATSLQLVQLAVLARLLKPSDFGLMGMVMVVIGFAQAFADMGMSNAIIYRQNTNSNQLSSLYWLNILAGIIVFGILVASSPRIAKFYGEPRLSNLIVWAALIFLITPIGQQFQILLQKELQFDRLAKVEVVGATLGVVVSIITAWKGQGVFALIWGQLVNTTCQATLLASLGWATWRPTLRFRLDDLKDYLNFGLYQMGERSINYFSANMDKLVIGKLLGSEPLGFYNLAYQLMIRPLSLLNPIITRVAFPVFSTIQNEEVKLKSGYLKIIKVIAFLNFPIYIGMFAAAHPLITLLLGSEWLPTIGVFKILVWLGIFYSLGNPIGSLLLAKGRADLGFWFNTFAIFVYAIAIYIGSHWGIQGVALSLLSSGVAILLPADFWLRWYLVQMKPPEYIRSFIPFLAISMVMGLGLIIIDTILPIGSPLIRLFILGTSGAFIYLIGILSFQKSFAKEILSMVLGKQ
jgi:O-antigen/teichoic acid export membrane protein